LSIALAVDQFAASTDPLAPAMSVSCPLQKPGWIRARLEPCRGWSSSHVSAPKGGIAMKRPQREPFPGGFPLSLVAPAPIDSDHAAMDIDVPTTFADPLPPNRLVVLGDSLSHGFKSFAVHETDISFPAMIAKELGWDAEFRRPHYAGPEICPGLPMNIEALIRAMERNATSLPLNLADQVATIASVLGHLKFYWEVGDGKKDPEDDRFNRLVLTAGLAWREVALLRAYCRYLRQTATRFSLAYIEDALSLHTEIARRLETILRAPRLAYFGVTSRGGKIFAMKGQPPSRLFGRYAATPPWSAS